MDISVSIDIGYIYSLLTWGRPQDLIAGGISDEMLKGDQAKSSLKFINDFFKQHGKLPPIQLVAEYSATTFPEIKVESLNYYTTEIRQRFLYQIIKTGLTGVTSKMDEKKPVDALEEVEKLLKTARQSQLMRNRVIKLHSLSDKIASFYKRVKNNELGIPSPWTTMNVSLMGFHPGDFIVFCGRLKTGKCLSASSKVVDSDTGEVLTLQEIVDRKRPTYRWKKDAGITRCMPNDFLYSGGKDGFDIVLSNGTNVIVSDVHPFLSSDGEEVSLENGKLKKGMFVGVAANYEFHKNPVKVEDELIIINALIMADGGMTSSCCTYSKKDKLLIGFLKEALSKYEFKLNPAKDDDCSYRIVRDECVDSFKKRADEFGLDFSLSKEKKVPKFIEMLKKEQLAKWIGLFWSSDGDVPSSKGTELTLASKELVYGIRHLLLRFGIYSKVKYKKSKCGEKYFDAWRLSVRGRYLDRFIEQIPLFGEKFKDWTKDSCKFEKENDTIPCSEKMKKRIEEIVDEGKHRDVFIQHVGYKLGFKDRYRSRKDKRRNGETFERESVLSRADGFSVSKLYSNDKRFLQLNRFQVFCEIYGCTHEFEWMWTDIEWSEITDINSVGMIPMYDLDLDNNWFIANDIIVHNTWMVLNVAKTAHDAGKVVLMVSAEMSQESLAMRYFSLDSGIQYSKIRKGQLGEFEEKTFYEELEAFEVKEGLFIFGEDFNLNIRELDAAIMDLKPDIVLIDGIYLLGVPGVTDRFKKAPILADELKMMAKRHKIPIVGTMQMSRKASGANEEDIDDSSVALSDSFGWNCDALFGMVRTKEMRESKELLVKTLAVREGDPFDMTLNWDFDRMDFSEKEMPKEVKFKDKGFNPFPNKPIINYASPDRIEKKPKSTYVKPPTAYKDDDEPVPF